MNIPIGPHQRQGRRRRRGKAVVLAAILVLMIAMLSVTNRENPSPSTHKGPSAPIPEAAINQAMLSPALKDIYIQQFPDLAEVLEGVE